MPRFPASRRKVFTQFLNPDIFVLRQVRKASPPETPNFLLAQKARQMIVPICVETLAGISLRLRLRDM